MEKLTAEFSIKLPAFLIVSGLEEDSFQCKAIIDGFDVKLTILPRFKDIRSKRSTDKFYTFCATEMKITVTGNWTTIRPNLLDDAAHYARQRDYLNGCLKKYQEVAQKVVNRTILYFRYKLHVPGVRPVSLMSAEGFYNPRWIDENGTNIGKGMDAHISNLIPGISDCSPNVKPLTVNELPALERSLTDCTKFEFHEEILADAHDAIYEAALQGNLRRAVLEMAIAAEIAVKRAYFWRDTVSGTVIDYLEDKGRLNVRVIELIDTVAENVFGSSFRKVNREAYEQIDFLFRCRNKVAHRGTANYKDDEGIVHEVYWSTLPIWWQSVQDMFGWLNSLPSKQDASGCP